MSAAFEELTLVLFTTLAPSGAIAVLIMGFPFLLGRVDDDQRRANDRFMCIPLAFTLVGLIASATHLGNPANALYVLAGVGRSPLSNEVFCAAAFLGLAGIYWVTSFDERPRLALRRTAFALIVLTGLAFVVAVAFAYDAETIVTWHSPFVPLGLVLGALAGGPLLALLGFALAEFAPAREGAGLVLLGISAAASAACVAVAALQGIVLAGIENHLTSALALVPGYFPALGAAAALFAAAVIAMFCARKKRSAFVACLAIACAFVFSALFTLRFLFYMAHLTVGVGL